MSRAIALVLLVLFFINVDVAASASSSQEGLSELVCSICQMASHNIHRRTLELATKQKRKSDVGEEAILEIVEDICNPMDEKGDWLRHLDVIHTRKNNNNEKSSSSLLTLKVHESMGKCNKECQSLSSLCSAIVDSSATEITETLYQMGGGEGAREVFERKMCNEVTKACKKKIKKGGGGGGGVSIPSSVSFAKDEVFETIKAEDVERERLLAKMKSGGMGGEMLSRQEILEEMEEEERRFQKMKQRDASKGNNNNNNNKDDENHHETVTSLPVASKIPHLWTYEGINRAAKRIYDSFGESLSFLAHSLHQLWQNQATKTEL